MGKGGLASPRVAPASPRQVAVRSVSVFGATGSIGASTIDLIKRSPERFRVEVVTAHRNVQALARIAREVGARMAVLADPAGFIELKDALAGTGIEVATGEAGLIEAAQHPVDWVMAAIAGSVGLKPTMAAIERGATVALANKECLVCAGALFMRRAKASGATVLPVDSEHNAVFQALGAGRRDDVSKIIITASGGPFRTWTLDQIRGATLEQALRHPNWSMGPKVTVDSATLMNKGLEVIEAHHLFNLGPDEIEVLVHPQSVVHGMVEFRDGSVVAQLGPPDMRVPIAHCLAWPERIDGPVNRLDLAALRDLTFEKPDLARFPALALAWQAMATGGSAPTVLNAADEVAVAEFIAGRIGFQTIPALVEKTLEAADRRGLLDEPASVEAALAIDHTARTLARDLLLNNAVKAF
ncbi:1-deoxy-D-xylulose 5-phosphate reductoisomerase [Pseudolabrys sp. Root1462]|uniref:1-deoxy-D-xylulose-5-phosphate reductoisomerase n=1 Tax=Pseudolabrys sp. Root1462 TaxID=1736466 RepID=UPI00070251B8|nr:1-deoxy-D-xylulose-5-phosphate reductoisomerase [Pseudolabrys sp. Root1462]KQZ02476.1 1-deoxy-D-xylulose 5-phosphate reductoisomerase [Pseudolabrys sp. Root1462]